MGFRVTHSRSLALAIAAPTLIVLTVSAANAAPAAGSGAHMNTPLGGGAATAPDDMRAPSPPRNLRTITATRSSITVAWSPSRDDVGVRGYGRYRNGRLVARGTRTRHTFAGLACATPYALAVDAYGAAGNRSRKVSVSGRTAACAPGAATVFLSTSGSDAAPCTRAQPCRSFDRAYRVATPGTTVEVGAGSYGRQPMTADVSKTSAADVVFRSARGASVRVGSMPMGAAHLELRDMRIGSIDFADGANDVTIRNVVSNGMWWIGSSNISIIGGEITCPTCDTHPHMQNSGTTPPRNILFDRVYFHDWHSQAGEHVECLQILGGDGITIRNSTFRNCGTANGGRGATAALHLQAYGGGPLPRNLLLEGNFFYASGNAYVIQGEDFENFDLRYNSIAGPILLYNGRSAGTGMDFVGNVMRSSACNAQNNAAPIAWRYNVIQGGRCGATDRNAASGFVDVHSNLHLRRGSAAVDAGDPTSYPARDIDGKRRPTGSVPDAGADELG